MSKIIQKTEGIAKKTAESLGLELVYIEFVKEGSARILRFYVDREGGVTTQDCEAFSRNISPLLDEGDFIEGKYYLEVSSPGICPPIRKISDYKKYSGRLADIALYTAYEGRKKFTAKIVGLSDDEKEVLFEIEDMVFAVPTEKISKAKLAYKF